MGDWSHIVSGFVEQLILLVLAASTLFMVLEVVGFLPPKWTRKINANRLAETLRLLKELGVDVEKVRRSNTVERLESVQGTTLADRVTARLEQAKITSPVSLGTHVQALNDNFIDLMGATSDPRVAAVYARDLTALWRELAGAGGKVANIDIDFIVTPKTGSPLLGAAFATLVEKPLLLHNPGQKFASEPPNPKALFDCRDVPALGARGLIVDDSSTGGDKALRLIADLQKCGWQVSDFLVIFEPGIKAPAGQNAATRLRPRGVTLHSIVRT